MGCCGGGGGGSFFGRRRSYQDDPGPALATREPGEAPDPVAILKERLARGEITLEDYQRLLEVVK